MSVAPGRVQALPKQPPHSMDAEQSVLGGLMLNNQIFADVADRISASDFYRTDHQLIFTGIAQMISANKRCDFVTLTEHLRSREKLADAGGAGYLGSLAIETYSVANVMAYADIVRERAVQRGLIAAGSDIGDMGYRPAGRGVEELLDHAGKAIEGLRRPDARAEGRSAAELCVAVEKRIEAARRRKPGEYAGLPTGFIEFDRRTNGLEAGDLVVIAARPAMGKSSVALNITEHTAIVRGEPAAFFSTEMPDEALMMRVLSSVARVPLAAIRSGQLNDADFDRLAVAQGLIQKAPMFLECRSGLSPLELRARARRLKAKRGIRLLVVDYLQRMTIHGSREQRTGMITEISNALKDLAMELGIPVIALSQLSRAVDDRPNKHPLLSDLRDSGAIEQDADIVAFIYREAYYDETKDKTKAEIDIAKQRSGPTGHFNLTFLGQFCKFDNQADESPVQ